MKALSIQQPYAFAITHGWKPVENRTWRTNFRGPFLIHTGKKELTDEVEGVLRRIASQIQRPYVEVAGLYSQRNKRGGFVGAAVISDCVTEHPSEWFCGPYGFVLEDATPFRGFVLIEALGQRGWFDAPASVVNDLDVWLGAWKHAKAAGVGRPLQ